MEHGGRYTTPAGKLEISGCHHPLRRADQPCQNGFLLVNDSQTEKKVAAAAAAAAAAATTTKRQQQQPKGIAYPKLQPYLKYSRPGCWLSQQRRVSRGCEASVRPSSSNSRLFVHLGVAMLRGAVLRKSKRTASTPRYRAISMPFSFDNNSCLLLHHIPS